MSYDGIKQSNYTGQTEGEHLKDYLVSVDKDLTNIFKTSSVFYQFGTGTNYSILTYTSTNYVWFPTVGSWNITSNLLYGGSGSTYIGLQPGTGIWMGNAAFGSAVFSVDPTGVMKAHSGEIGGWTIGTTILSSTNLLFDSANETIQNVGFVSGPLGSGFQIEPTVAEFQNIRIRGKVTNAVFEKDVISSIGGNFLVSDSDILDADMDANTGTDLTISGDTVFAIDDILRIKDGDDDEWFQITGSKSAYVYEVDRDKAGDYTVTTNPEWKKGTAVVNYGANGEGLIFMTASETNAPHIDVLTHSGSPWTTTTTRMRMGNINGFLGETTDKYGIAIGASGKSLKYTPEDGLEVIGSLSACTISASTINTTSLTSATISASNINTTSLTSATISASTINTTEVTIDGNGYVRSSDYVATTTGFNLSPTSGLEVWTGSISAQTLQLKTNGGIVNVEDELAKQELFTASGTFTAPSTVSLVYITGCGAGGGGGGTQQNNQAAGGGGGAFAERVPVDVTGGNEYQVTVGAGGAGGAAGDNNGVNGGNGVRFVDFFVISLTLNM